jgi:hypothetical protein
MGVPNSAETALRKDPVGFALRFGPTAIVDLLTGAKMAAQRVARTILCRSDPNEMQHDL